MKTEKWLEFLVFSNMWVALVCTLLYWQTTVFYHVPAYGTELLCVFFFTLCSYSFQRIFLFKAKPEKRNEQWWMRWKKALKVQFWVSGALAVVFFPARWIENYPLVLLLGGVSVFYAWRTPFLGGRSLREFPLLKIFLISGSWGILTSTMVFSDTDVEMSVRWWAFIERTCWVFAFTLPFDLRDADEEALPTVATFLGYRRGVFLASSLAFLSALIQWGMLDFTPGFCAVVGAFLASFLLIQTRRSRGEFFYSLWMEGALLAPLTVYVLYVWGLK